MDEQGRSRAQYTKLLALKMQVVCWDGSVFCEYIYSFITDFINNRRANLRQLR